VVILLGTTSSQLEASRRADVIKVTQVVINLGIVQHAAEATQGDAKAVGATEATKLAASFDMRFQIEEHAGDATAAEFALQTRELFPVVPQDVFMGTITDVGWHKVL
jgi:hypothetical protein